MHICGTRGRWVNVLDIGGSEFFVTLTPYNTWIDNMKFTVAKIGIQTPPLGKHTPSVAPENDYVPLIRLGCQSSTNEMKYPTSRWFPSYTTIRCNVAEYICAQEYQTNLVVINDKLILIRMDAFVKSISKVLARLPCFHWVAIVHGGLCCMMYSGVLSLSSGFERFHMIKFATLWLIDVERFP